MHCVFTNNRDVLSYAKTNVSLRCEGVDKVAYNTVLIQYLLSRERTPGPGAAYRWPLGEDKLPGAVLALMLTLMC
jgi:hypothetical protein